MRRAPNAVALTFEDRCLTYAELNEQANRLAHYLREHGVGPETLVGLCVMRGPDMVIGLLGILKAGGAYLPIDPMYPIERLTFLLSDSQISTLVCQESTVKDLPTSGLNVVCLDKDQEILNARGKNNIASNAEPENLAYMIYTSGSTGNPKGVMVSHANVLRLLRKPTTGFSSMMKMYGHSFILMRSIFPFGNCGALFCTAGGW